MHDPLHLHPRSRPSSSSAPSPEAVVILHRVKSQPSSDRKLNLAWRVLLALLVANLAALVANVWVFLPDHAVDFSFSGGSNGISTDGEGIDFDGGGNGVETASRSYKRRIRREPDNNDDPSELIRQALSKEDVVRYDFVPSVLDRTGAYYGVVHQLPSIPDRRRMIPQETGRYAVPSDAVCNLTYFLESRDRPHEEDRPLFIYNPMVLPLENSSVGGAILSDLSSSNDADAGDAAYVGVYRVSNFGNCHGPRRGVPETFQNYLGLALLDRDLNIVRDRSTGGYLDVVIDLNAHLHDIGWKPHSVRHQPGKGPGQYMQDCQLLAPSGTGGLILLCNQFAMPVRLQREGRRTDVGDSKLEGGKGGKSIRFRNSYGSGLRLTALQKPDLIKGQAKNLHFFSGAAGADRRDGSGFIEIWPGGPHESLPINFSIYPFVKPPVTALESSRSDPAPSFATIDTPRRGKDPDLMMNRDSGSACCVPISWQDGRHLLLGFSHRKTRKGVGWVVPYNYVSRVYAFDTAPPFDIVARSGFFCLGFAPVGGDSGPGDEVKESDNEQVRGAANEYRLRLKYRKTDKKFNFECPRIHFVTGIAEKVGDKNRVIISYGVNDCYPRMIEVSKDFLVSLLRP